MGRDAAEGETVAQARARLARESATKSGAGADDARKVVKRIEPARIAEGSSSGGSGWLYAVLGVVVVAGIFVVLRHRRAAAEFEPEPVEETSSIEAENPFAARTGEGGEKERPPLRAKAEDAEAGFDPHAADTAVSGMGIGSVSPGAADSSEDTGRMMQEFERRIASLESRLDDVVDARERLERQVAAQTEELRVQRAAIARTQRAVRNLSRTEDEGGATEPAIRDPES